METVQYKVGDTVAFITEEGETREAVVTEARDSGTFYGHEPGKPYMSVWGKNEAILEVVS